MENIEAIINSISKERQIDKEMVASAIRWAFVQTARKIISNYARFDIDFTNKDAMINEVYVVVENNSNSKEESKEHKEKRVEGAIYLDYARRKFDDENIQVGDEIRIPHNLSSFGRNGSEILYKEIEEEIERAKSKSLYFKYKDRIGEKIRGKVIHVDEEETTIVDIDEGEDIKAILKRKDRIKGEEFKVGNVLSAIIKRVEIDKDVNKVNLELSRTHLKYLEALLYLEVPEIQDGTVMINGLARIPGNRAKVAVTSNNPKIDPISAVIGAKGNRINAISREINNEIIDCINYSSNPKVYIKNALSPATIKSIKMKQENLKNGKTIMVAYAVLDNEERGRAIGKGGANLKLAKMLTGFEIRLLTSETDNEQSYQKEENNKSVAETLGALFN